MRHYERTRPLASSWLALCASKTRKQQAATILVYAYSCNDVTIQTSKQQAATLLLHGGKQQRAIYHFILPPPSLHPLHFCYIFLPSPLPLCLLDG